MKAMWMMEQRSKQEAAKKAAKERERARQAPQKRSASHPGAGMLGKPRPGAGMLGKPRPGTGMLGKPGTRAPPPPSIPGRPGADGRRDGAAAADDEPVSAHDLAERMLRQQLEEASGGKKKRNPSSLHERAMLAFQQRSAANQTRLTTLGSVEAGAEAQAEAQGAGRAFDTNGDGLIDVDELIQGLASPGAELSGEPEPEEIASQWRQEEAQSLVSAGRDLFSDSDLYKMFGVGQGAAELRERPLKPRDEGYVQLLDEQEQDAPEQPLAAATAAVAAATAAAAAAASTPQAPEKPAAVDWSSIGAVSARGIYDGGLTEQKVQAARDREAAVRAASLAEQNAEQNPFLFSHTSKAEAEAFVQVQRDVEVAQLNATSRYRARSREQKKQAEAERARRLVAGAKGGGDDSSWGGGGAPGGGGGGGTVRVPKKAYPRGARPAKTQATRRRASAAAAAQAAKPSEAAAPRQNAALESMQAMSQRCACACAPPRIGRFSHAARGTRHATCCSLRAPEADRAPLHRRPRGGPGHSPSRLSPFACTLSQAACAGRSWRAAR